MTAKQKYGIWVDSFRLIINYKETCVKHCGTWCQNGKQRVLTFTDVEAAKASARDSMMGCVDHDIHMVTFEPPRSPSAKYHRRSVLSYRVRPISDYEIQKVNRALARGEKMIEARNRQWEEEFDRKSMTVEQIEKQIFDSELYHPMIKQLLADLCAAYDRQRGNRKKGKRAR